MVSELSSYVSELIRDEAWLYLTRSGHWDEGRTSIGPHHMSDQCVVCVARQKVDEFLEDLKAFNSHPSYSEKEAAL